MTLKSATKLAIAGLSLSLLMGLTRTFWMQWLLLSNSFEVSTLYTLVGIVDLLLYFVPLIIFFVVLYQKQN